MPELVIPDSLNPQMVRNLKCDDMLQAVVSACEGDPLRMPVPHRHL